MGNSKSKLAMIKIASAINHGDLIRPDTCEICEWSDTLAKELKRFYELRWPDNRFIREMKPSAHIVAHHWRGYEYPLDIWWVCKSCNSWLPHDGSLSKDEAKKNHKNWRHSLLKTEQEIEQFWREKVAVIDVSHLSETAQHYFFVGLEDL